MQLGMLKRPDPGPCLLACLASLQQAAWHRSMFSNHRFCTILHCLQVCQVTLPASGARLLIGSDGLWDAVHPKVRPADLWH